MKKHSSSLITLLAAFSLVVSSVMPVIAQAQVSAVTCPAGYVCTVIPTTPGCPTGYICSPATGDSGSSAGGGGGGGSVASSSNATVTVNGTPALALTYDSSNKESQLTATFDITVSGNATGVNIYQSSGGVAFYNANGTSPNLNSQASRIQLITPNISTVTDNQGQPMYSIPAGRIVEFSVTGTASPSQMFAGSYYASFVGLYANTGTNINNGFNISVPTNKTNSKTIVGERSPYITGFNSTQPFMAGQTVTVLGQRLDTSAAIFIDGNSIGSNAKGNSTSFALNLPASLTDGSHTLQVRSASTGASNNVGFQVQSNGGGTSCYSFSTDLGLGMVNSDVVALQTYLIANGYHIAAIESGKQDKGYYGNQTGDAVSRLQAAVGVSDRKYAGYGYFGVNTRGWVNSHCTTTPPPSTGSAMISGTSATLGSPTVDINGVTQNYPVTFTFTLTAGNNTIYLGTYADCASNASIFFNCKDNNIVPSKGSIVANPGQLSGDTSNFLIVPAGSSRQFSFVGTLDKANASSNGIKIAQVIAIQYGTSPSNLLANQINSGLQNLSVSANFNGITTTSCPANYICTAPGATTTCPAGYVCVATTVNCPPGYTCYTSSPVTTNPPTTCTSGTSGAGYQFSTDLTVGSTGPDVVALQTWLIANGYHIAGIESGAVAKGYYDAQTKTAVAQYQAAVGIPATGFVGPLTRGILNAGCGGGTTVTCPPGYICTTPGQPTNNNTISFQADFTKTFNLGNVPSSATLGVAADNNYVAYVNGQYVGTGRNESAGQGNNNFDNVTNFNVAPYLHSGSNTLKITGENYYSSAPSWPDNAFGLLYKLTDSSGNILAASDGSETIGSATLSGGSSVVLSQPHPWYIRPAGASWIWDSADPLYATYLTYIGASKGPTQLPGLTVSPISVTSGQQVTLSYVAPSNATSMTLSLSCPTGVSMPYGTGGNDNCNTSVTWTPSFPTASYMTAINKTTSVQRVNVSLSAKYPDGSSGGMTGYVDVQPGTQTNSQSPIILGITSPTQLNVGQTGTWSISASDPQNSSLSYSINWGDNACPTGYVCSNASASTQFVQQASFTHSYASAGTYTVSVTVKNSAGRTAQSSATVNVTNSTVTPPTTASVSASVVDASSDKVGYWGVFAPGPGRANGNNPYDWHFSGTVSNASGKTLSYVTIIMNGIREGWSTSASTNNAFGVQLYPLVMVGPAFQTSAADQTMSIGSNSTHIDLYAQPEDAVGTTFRGATLTVGFTDGTTATAQIPSSSVSIPANTTSAPSSVTATLDSSSPLSGLVQISSSAQTQNVPLLVVDLKSTTNSTLQALNVGLNLSGKTAGSVLSNMQLRAGGQTYSVSAITDTSAQFTNMNIPMSANVVTPITILATIASDSTGSLNGTNISAQFSQGGLSVVDTNSYQTVPVQSFNTINGSTLSLSSSLITASNLSATLGSAITGSSGTIGYNVSFSFTLTAGNSTVFIAADPSVSAPTSVTGNITGSLSSAGVSANPGQISGDSSNYYVIPAGSSRQFTLNGSIMGTGAGNGFSSMSINQINYGVTTSNLQSGSINSNLQSLKVTATLGGASAMAPSQSSMTAAIYDAIRAYYAGH